MQGAAARMQVLIDSLQRYSRIGTGDQSFRPVDLNEVVKDVVNDLSGIIGQTAAQIEVDGLPIVEADAPQMRELLSNLIGNALKFRCPDRAPVIRITATDDLALDEPIPGMPPCGVYRLTVADNGIGFDEKYRGRIFEVFQRLGVAGTTADAYEGAGIGLAICRRLSNSITAR
jgi:light-regulated signal transduction histidine kinase (bacteriophytochrome)